MVGGAVQPQAPVLPISSHPGYPRSLHMYHSQNQEGMDPSLYSQRSGGGTVSPTSQGSCENMSDNHESPPMTLSSRLVGHLCYVTRMLSEKSCVRIQ